MANSYEIKQLYPAYNLKTNERMERAESCEILLYVKSALPCTDADVVKACRADEAHVPPMYLGMRLMAITVTERIDPKNWKASASYQYYHGTSNGKHVLPPEKVSIEFGSATARRTVSMQQVHRYGAMPDYGGLLDVQESGDGGLVPQGVEVMVPTGSMTITHYFSRRKWNTKLRNTIAYSRCRTNSETFRGFEAGELLFVGESVSYSEKDNYVEVQFRFLISQNADDLEVGSIKGISKQGWESLWVKYKKGIATVKGKQYQIIEPDGVSVDKVYKSADFTLMGLAKNEGRANYAPTMHWW